VGGRLEPAAGHRGLTWPVRAARAEVTPPAHAHSDR
jgi:hypothetical protein